MAFKVRWNGCIAHGPMKELEDENRHFKNRYAEERLKAEVVQQAMAKKW